MSESLVDRTTDPKVEKARKPRHPVLMELALQRAAELRGTHCTKTDYDYIVALADEFLRVGSERYQLLKALEDLSFECDGVTCVVAPSRKTYNRTFAVLRKIRDGVIIEVPK